MLFPASFRRVLCSAVLVLGTLSVLPGCKHSYRSHGVDSTLNPRFSSQPVDADYDDRAERNLSPRFESFPDLSPVPPLPGAGHSLPSDDALPPSPSPDSVSPTSLQLDSNPSTNPSPAIEPNLSPVAESSPRWKQMWKVPSFPKRAVAQPLPPLKPGRYSSSIVSRTSAGSATEQGVGVRPQSALMHSAQFALRPSSPAFKSEEAGVTSFQSLGSASPPSTGLTFNSLPASGQSANNDALLVPVITPVIAPIRTRSGQIEQWPHVAKKSISSASGSVKDGESNPADNRDPAEASLTELLPLPIANQFVEDAGSPSLLPPGP